MQNPDWTELIEQLQSSRRIFLDAVANLEEDPAKARTGEAWSVLDCVEHCAGAERGMFMMVTKMAETGAVSGDRSATETFIRGYGENREKKSAAPDVAKPKGRYETLALAVSRFSEARDRTIAYVEQTDEDLNSRMLDHPLVGRITSRECLVLMAQHAVRHAAQIRDIRTARAGSGIE